MLLETNVDVDFGDSKLETKKRRSLVEVRGEAAGRGTRNEETRKRTKDKCTRRKKSDNVDGNTMRADGLSGWRGRTQGGVRRGSR